jgi:hypothetical protein
MNQEQVCGGDLDERNLKLLFLASYFSWQMGQNYMRLWQKN